MAWKKTQDAIFKAFNERFTDFASNREAAICAYNSLVEGDLIQRAMPRMFESWKDEKGRELVAIPTDQMEALLDIRDKFGQIMQSQGKNLHGIDNSWRISYQNSVSKEECTSCGKEYNIKDMTYVEPDGVIKKGQYCPDCFKKRYDHA